METDRTRLDELLLNAPHQAATGPWVLEVHQVWGTWVVDTRHVPLRAGARVRTGPGIQHRWEVLGADMGRVPRLARTVLGLAPGSEVVPSPEAELFAPTEALLFEEDDSAWVAHVPAHGAQVERDDGVVDLDPGPYHLQPGERLDLTVDGIAYHARLVPRGQRVDRGVTEPDLPLLSTGSTLGFLGLMFALVTAFAPRPAATELVDLPDRFAVILEPPADVSNEPEPPGDKEDEGSKAPDEEGRKGSPKAKQAVARGGADKAKADRQVAESAGLLGGMDDDPMMAAMFSSSSLASALDAGAGGLIGVKGQQIGSNGLGVRGGSWGGGGEIGGVGGLGTHGIGVGDRAYGDGGGAAKKEEGAIVRGHDPLLVGSMDRAVVDEVVKKHLNQLRYCYQREVTKDPNLSGKVVTRFVIARDGTVSSASTKDSSVGSAAVDSCVANTFRKMRFPEPGGGGIVVVSYPLMFSI